MNIELEDVLDAIDDPTYVLKRDGSFVFANHALIQLTGYSRNDFYNMNVFAMEKKGRINPAVSHTVIRTKKRIEASQHVTNKNEIVNRLMITQNPIFDENGEVNYLVGVLKDVEDINQRYTKVIKESNVSIFKHSNDKTVSSKKSTVISESKEMKALLEQASNLATVDTSVLLLGESGTGKEVVSNFIHSESQRKHNEMIKINCASLPESLLEAELFGYEKGAYTGANESGKVGLIELAHQGTLFLDEIDAMPQAIQAKLLRVLETRMIKRIGSVKEKISDFRLITATNADLKTLVKQKRFRQDLYFRLNVVPLKIPPLRDRIDDIVPLGEYYLNIYCDKYSKNKQFSENVFNIMKHYSWPGNVRELKNFVERMVVMTQTAVIEVKDIPKELLMTTEEYDVVFKPQKETYNVHDICEKLITSIDIENKSYKELMDDFEAEVIQCAMNKYKTTYKAAEVLGVNQSTIHRKYKKRLARKC